MAEEAKKVLSSKKRKFTYMEASIMAPHELEAVKKTKEERQKWHKFFPLSVDELMAKIEDELNQSGEG
eukprot:6127714-Ditylum_brightwellii.AAC.1